VIHEIAVVRPATSGMKAALNGVPSLSVLDGWWVEGCYEGVTGWSSAITMKRLTRPTLSTSVWSR
jgi:hypothetical protein